MHKKESPTYNQHISTVLEFLYRNRHTSRIEISNSTGLTPALITSITGDLFKKNLIEETGDEKSEGSGRKRKILTLSKDFGYFLGIEFNVSGIYVMVTDLIGNEISKSHFTFNGENNDHLNKEIIDQINLCTQDIDHSQIIGAGIALPGHYDYSNKKIVSNNLAWKCFDLDEIKKHFSFPFIVNNNVECMSLGEYLFHPDESPEDFLFYHIGYGIYCSCFHAEQLRISENYYIGEVGHIVVDINGPQCECGKNGCLQTYISESWLIKNGKYLFRESSNSILKSLVATEDEITLDTIITAYKLGDPYFIKTINLGLSLLSTSVANILMLHECDKIYLNSKLFSYKAFQEQLISLIQKQLEFIPDDHGINMQIEIVDFNQYRGANSACALASFAFFIKSSDFEKYIV